MNKNYIVKPMNLKYNFGEVVINSSSPLNAVKQYLKQNNIQGTPIKATNKFFEAAYKMYPNATAIEISGLIDIMVELENYSNDISGINSYHIQIE